MILRLRSKTKGSRERCIMYRGRCSDWAVPMTALKILCLEPQSSQKNRSSGDAHRRRLRVASWDEDGLDQTLIHEIRVQVNLVQKILDAVLGAYKYTLSHQSPKRLPMIAIDGTTLSIDMGNRLVIASPYFCCRYRTGLASSQITAH